MAEQRPPAEARLAAAPVPGASSLREAAAAAAPRPSRPRAGARRRGSCAGSAPGTRRGRSGSCSATTSTPSTSPSSCSLHLTYHVHGDRRQRGMALLRLKQALRGGRPRAAGRRAARLPAGDARVRRARPRRARRATARGPPRRARAGPRRPARGPRARIAPLLDAVVACLGRLSSPQARPDPARSPPRARRPRRSGSSRSRRPR